MKSKFLSCFLLVCLLAFGYNAQGQDKLTPEILNPDLNPNVTSGVPLIGGSQTDVITAAWTTLAVSPKAQSRTFCVYIANGGVEYIYQFGGGATTQLTSIARYDIAANSWTLLGSTLNLAVSSGAAVADGDSVIYVFGGNSPTTLGSTQKFNVNTGVTTTMATMPNLITDAGVVKYHDTLVYVIGGGTGLFGTGYINNVNLYNMRSNTYSAATAYPIAAGMMGFGIHGDTIICAGGWNGVTGVANAYRGAIDPATPTTITWTAIPNYPLGGVTRMASYFARKGEGRAIVFTGGAILGATLTNRTYLWDICNGRWDSTVANSQARSNFKAAGRGDSVVWVVAGFTTVGVGTTERLTISRLDCGGVPIANDVAVTAINAPTPGAILLSCPSIKVAPKATFQNFGSAFAAYSATYQITGPVPYTSTRSDTLSSGGTRTITFDSTFQANTVGTYNVRVFITYPADSNHANDTLTSTFTIINPNFGGGLPANCNYFFANSTPCSPPPPASPIFFWRDTVGSTYLIKDTSVQTAPGVFNGTKDDGHWRLEIPGTDQFRFCGVNYDSFFVTTNGMIGLTLANGNTGRINSFTTLTIPNTGALSPGLFPFWHDFNFGTTITGSKSISYKTLVKPVDGLILIITYDRAPDFGATSPTDYASFQIAIQLNTGAVDGRIIYQYDDSRTGATFLSEYFGLTLGPHTVGIQDVTGTLGIQYRRVTGAGPAGVIAAGPLFATPIAVAFGPDATVLPVELASFTSTVNRRDVTLNWSTATELNNAGFDVERSMVNGQWSMVGNVAGNGTTSSPMNYSFTERNLASGKYNYRLKQIDLNGNFEYFNLGNEVGIGIPTKYDLAQNYPNPFNPTTKINYDIAFDGKVSIKIFDISGREVSTLVNDVQTAGYYTIDFNGSNLSSGAYFYRISADGNGQNFVATKKMVLVK